MAEENPKLVEAPSAHSLAEATRSRAKFSGHGRSLGAAGYRDPGINDYEGTYAFLTAIDQSISISPPPQGFEDFHVGVAWNNTPVTTRQDTSFLGKLLKSPVQHIISRVDLDLGCLYEMQDGTRGVVQAFGKRFGNYDEAPFIVHSGDERVGKKEGADESLTINGAEWNKIKKVLVYAYIYKGAAKWAEIKPQIHIDVPGEKDLIVTLGAYDGSLELCVIGELENVRGGIRLINRSEYFPGHAEMDRAYGFGLQWVDGEKSRE